MFCIKLFLTVGKALSANRTQLEVDSVTPLREF